MSFAGKLALVTGGSSGIGKAVAAGLLAAGAQVLILARDRARLEGAAGQLRSHSRRPEDVEWRQLDVTDFVAVERLRDELLATGRSPDHLFNMAGIVRPGRFHELPPETFRQQMEVNYFGSLHTVQAFAPAMMARRCGHIVNTSSMAGFLGVFGYTAYCASKFAIRGFSEALRAEMKPYGVRVSVLFPPDTDTPQLHDEEQYKPPETKALAGQVKVMSPESVAHELLRGVERGCFLIIPGAESKLAYGLIGLLGSKMHLYFDWIIRRAQASFGGPPPVELPTPENSGAGN